MPAPSPRRRDVHRSARRAESPSTGATRREVLGRPAAPSLWQRALTVPRRTKRRFTALAAVTVTAALAGTTFVAVTADADPRTPKGTIQAERFSAQSGAQVERTSDVGGGKNVGWLTSGDWLQYKGVQLGRGTQVTTSVRVASDNAKGGTLELRADSLAGPVLASYPIASTQGWQKWVTLTATTTLPVSGKHDVFVTVHSPQPADFVNLNWFSIRSSGTPSAPPTSSSPVATSPVTQPSVTTGTPMPSMTHSLPPPTTGTTAPSPTTTMPGMPGMATPTPGAWVTIDPAQQAADTRAFFARQPKPVTGNPVQVPEFHATCTVSHHGNDDPIVFPGQAGASHNHTFLGNTTTDADSTLTSLRTGRTTCTPTQDLSAYWVPTLYQQGKPIDPTEVTVYYGSRLKDPSRTQPFPAGFRMLTGDAKQQVDTPDKQGNHFWCAGIGGEIGRTADGTFPICAPTAHLVRQITFADCWDGKHLDSPDHRSHVSNGVNGACPAAFPVAIPNISFVMSYPLSADTRGITLASGTSYSMHADFFNAWDDNPLAERIRNCLDQGVKCNAQGGF